MTNTNNTAIHALRNEASAAGDDAMISTCSVALDEYNDETESYPSPGERAEALYAIADALAAARASDC